MLAFKAGSVIGMQPRSDVKRIAAIGFVAVTVALAPIARAQYSANFQTNTFNGTTNTFSGTYIVGSNTYSDVLLIRNRGRLNSTLGSIGYEVAASNNYVLVDGTGSVWNVSIGGLTVGWKGGGNSLVVSNGGNLSTPDVGSNIYVGQSSSWNRVSITGTGSVWSTYYRMYIGGEASAHGARGTNNSIIVENGGSVTGESCDVYGGNNTIVVTGTGSVWRSIIDLQVGTQLSGSSLVISNGGRVISSTTRVGVDGGSSDSSILVTGSGVLSNTGPLSIGLGGNRASLVISNGGQVVTMNASLGANSSTVRVVDSGVFINNSSLVVGSGGLSNSLVVAGGSVFATNFAVGGCSDWVQLDSGDITVTNATGDATLDLRGEFIFNGGILRVDKLVVTDPCGLFLRNGGTLIISNLVLDASLDADGDGMANGWEQAYGLDPLNAADASADNDGDGMSNLQEYLAGTDPTNNASAFRILGVVATNNDVLVSWTAGGGRTNVVQAAPGLAGGYANVSPNIVIIGSGDVTTNYLDTGAATNAAGWFYRIKLVP